MKKTIIFLFFLSFLNCKKDDCGSCSLILQNGEQFVCRVSFSGWPGAPTNIKLQGAEVQTFSDVPAGAKIIIRGDFQTNFAHTDYEGDFQCPGDCGTVAVTMKMD